MSQIKKLLFGETIPKAQEGYKFNLDGQDIYYSDDDLKEIGDRIAALDNNYKRFLGNAVAAIKGGNQSGNRASNTISMDQLSGLSAKDLKRLSKNGSYWETISGKDSYHAREAISAYLNILHSVANKPKKEEKSSKTKIDKNELPLDYNTKEGKKYLSPTNENNINARNRVAAILEHIKEGDNSKYEAPDYKMEAISTWLNGLDGDDKNAAGKTFFDNLWSAMGNGEHKYDPDIEDLFAMFGIKYGLSDQPANVQNVVSDTADNKKIEELIEKIATLEKQINDYSNPVNQNEEPTQIVQQPLTAESTPVQNLIYNPFGKKQEAFDGKQGEFEVLKYFNIKSSLGGHYLIRDNNGKYYIYHNTKDNPDNAVVGKHGKNNTSYLYAIDEAFAKGIENETIKFPTIDEIRAHSSNGRGLFGLNFRTKRGVVLDKSKIINKEDGGKIDSSKINSFVAKHDGILKGKDGLPKIQLKYPHSVERRVEQRPDGTTVAVEEIHDNYGNITINEKEISNAQQPIQQPEKAEEPKQEEQTKQEPVVIIQKPAEVIAKKAPENNTEYKQIWVEPKQLPIVNVPNVPLAKQKIAPIKGTKKYDLNDLVEVLGRLADQKQYVAKGGKVLKGQNGLTSEDIEAWRASGRPLEALYELIAQQQQEVAPENAFNNSAADKYQMAETAKAIAEQQTGNSGAGNLNQVATKSGNTEKVTTQPSDLGNYNFNIPSTYKYLSPAISAGRFLTTSLFQKKYYDAAKDMLNAGRFNEMAVWANAPSTNMPVLDRQLQQVNRERMMGVKPVTSNFIDNFAATNTRENQLWARENDIYAKQSAQYQDIKKQITDIQNQNLANSIATRNQNIARQKAIDSAIKQQYLEFLQRHAQSVENLGLEFQNNVTNDINYMNNYNQFKFEDAQQKNFDKYIDGLFPNYRAMYNQLGYNERAKYSNFLDYMEKVHPDIYNPKMEEIINRQSQDQEALLEWQRRNKLNYWYPKALFGINSSAGIDRMKKGGRVNGNTRYTLEPDERIWIENNKATHRAIGKLSDNTIKLLLKALK